MTYSLDPVRVSLARPWAAMAGEMVGDRQATKDSPPGDGAKSWSGSGPTTSVCLPGALNSQAAASPVGYE